MQLVYQELRRLAAAMMVQESPGQTLQATALVHEAYVRLVDVKVAQHWNSRGHFFAAAAEAMRRILVDAARRRATEKHGGKMNRHDAAESQLVAPEASEDLLALDEALDALAADDPVAAELVKLRFFTGLTVDEAARHLSISPRKAHYDWQFARSWLRRKMGEF